MILTELSLTRTFCFFVIRWVQPHLLQVWMKLLLTQIPVYFFFSSFGHFWIFYSFIFFLVCLNLYFFNSRLFLTLVHWSGHLRWWNNGGRSLLVIEAGWQWKASGTCFVRTATTLCIDVGGFASPAKWTWHAVQPYAERVSLMEIEPVFPRTPTTYPS